MRYRAVHTYYTWSCSEMSCIVVQNRKCAEQDMYLDVGRQSGTQNASSLTLLGLGGTSHTPMHVSHHTLYTPQNPWTPPKSHPHLP